MGRRKGTGVWGIGGGTEPLEKNWWVKIPYGVVWKLFYLKDALDLAEYLPLCFSQFVLSTLCMGRHRVAGLFLRQLPTYEKISS